MRSRNFTPNFHSLSSKISKLLPILFLFAGILFCNTDIQAQNVIVIEAVDWFAGPVQGNNFNFQNGNEPNISVSPNPISSHASIRKDADVDLVKFEILDLNGNIKFSTNQKSGAFTTPYMDPGTYLFKYSTNKGLKSELVTIL